MANFHASLDCTCKRRILKYSHVGSGGSIFDPKLWKIYIDIFHGVSNLHFQYKNGKLTFSNGPQLMQKSLWQIVMHHCMVCEKKKNFKNFHVGSGVSIPQLLILNWEMKDLHWYPAILSALQSLLICILNRKKW